MTPSEWEQKIDRILCQVRPLHQAQNRPFGEYSARSRLGVVILELGGHRVEVARGVAIARATAPEIAGIDIAIPAVDSHEVGRRTRAAGCEG